MGFNLEINRAGRSGALCELLLAARSLIDSGTTSGKNETAFAESIATARLANPWFTAESIKRSVEGLAHMVRPEAYSQWLDRYPPFGKNDGPKRIGLILAGNIPMVGFHDVLSVLAAGHTAVVKPSGQDAVLLPALFRWIFEAFGIAPTCIEYCPGILGPVDAVIATGSNNSARYFEYYFGHKPHLIRRNRSSAAILTGAESDDDLAKLGSDIFTYFGLGCRNVSKLLIHEDFEINRFFEAVYPWHEVIHHHKYANNYDYYKALWLMNREDLLDNGFLLLRKGTGMHSPVGSLLYERYADVESVKRSLSDVREEIQCVVSLTDVPFGKSQEPELWDYADGVDTIDFLRKL